jgi:prepilin-type processing-associated H-X9-DG protein
MPWIRRRPRKSRTARCTSPAKWYFAVRTSRTETFDLTAKQTPPGPLAIDARLAEDGTMTLSLSLTLRVRIVGAAAQSRTIRMTTDQAAVASDEQLPAKFQFRLVHILYAYALLGASLAVFGCFGLAVAPVVLGFWAYVYCHRSRPRALADACLMLLLCSCLICLLLPGISAAREAARRMQCTNHLKLLGLALHNYHEIYGQFPPASVPDQDGKPMHSWRLLILPFIEEQPLYQQYDFDEPWDGPNNRRLLSQVPYVYQCPSDVRSGRGISEWTSYVAVVDAQAAWPGSTSAKFSDFTAGTALTILVLEDQSQKIPWMEPRDLTLDQAVSVLSSQDPQFAGVHRQDDFFYEYSGGRQVAFADGSVRYLSDGLPRDLVTSLLRIDEQPDQTLLDLSVSPARTKRLKLFNCFLLALFVTLTLFPLPWVWIKPR